MANELPGHKSAWENNVKVEKLENKTIHNVDLTSASTISDEQYLILRALWKRYKFDQLDLAKFGLEDWNTKAIEMLKTYQSWTHHCNSFSSNAENEGTFSLPQFYQKQVALIPDDIPFRPNVTVGTSPVAHHTRSRMSGLESGIQKISFETPAKPPSTPNLAMGQEPGTPDPGSDEEFDDSIVEETADR